VPTPSEPFTHPTPTDRAEAELARELRARGMRRMTAALTAARHNDRFLFGADGALSVRLADGSTVPGDAGIQALAAELLTSGLTPR